jgi:hypothetical protein
LVLKENSEGLGELTSSDAPMMSQADKDRAFDLLSDLSSQGGRTEKRTVRGAAPMLASFDGTGFLMSDDRKCRDLGSLFLEKVIKEPSILSAVDVSNLLIGVQLLITHGPGSSGSVAKVTFEGLGIVCSTGWYVDLDDWASTEDGRHAAHILEAVAKALDYRLVKYSREQSKGDYEAAFAEGYGWAVCIPLVQGPEVFAKSAMSCMASMPNVPRCAATALGSILGFPTPMESPAVSHMKKVLTSSVVVRALAAKLLAKSVTSDGFMQYLNEDGMKCMTELMKLIASISFDGKHNLEAFHDMLYVVYTMSQTMPDPLYKCASEDIISMLVGLSKKPVEDAPVFYARGILSTLKLNHTCNKVIKATLDRFDAGIGADAEDTLKAN